MSNQLTPATLRAALELAEKATPGPVKVCALRERDTGETPTIDYIKEALCNFVDETISRGGSTDDFYHVEVVEPRKTFAVVGNGATSAANAHFIATARNLFEPIARELLARMEREETDKETLAEAIRAKKEQRRIGVRALQMANDSEGKNNLLRAERDAALAELAGVKEQLTEATRALGVIGDRAVCDWDSATVGEADAALAKIPQTYRDAYIAWARWAIDAHKRAERAEAALREVVEQLRNNSANAYCAYSDAGKNMLCLGEAIKLEKGEFSQANLDAHRKRAELIGEHKAFVASARILEREIAALAPASAQEGGE